MIDAPSRLPPPSVLRVCHWRAGQPPAMVYFNATETDQQVQAVD